MTTAEGSFTICGPDQPFALQYTCTGTSCSGLDSFPNTTCTTSGTTLTCSNGVTCSGPSNFTADFTLTQPIKAVVQTWDLKLTDLCTTIEFNSNGTTSGFTSIKKDTGGCADDSGSSSVSSGPASASTTSKPYGNSTTSRGGSSYVTYVTTIGTKVETVVTCPGSDLDTAAPSTTPGHACTTCGAGGAGGTGAGGPTTAHSSASATSTPKSSQPIVTVSAASMPKKLGPGLLLSVFLVLFALFPSAMALGTGSDGQLDVSPIGVAQRSPDPVEADMIEVVPGAVSVRKDALVHLSDRDLTPFWKKFSELASEYLSGKVTDPSVADTVVAEIEDAVCSHMAAEVVSKALTRALKVDLIAEVTEACMAAAAIVFIPSGPIGEIAVALISGTLCGVLVSEAFPGT